MALMLTFMSMTVINTTENATSRHHSGVVLVLSLLLPSCRKLEFRLSAFMDSDLAWVNGKSGRQS